MVELGQVSQIVNLNAGASDAEGDENSVDADGGFGNVFASKTFFGMRLA
jgi:hypothetical protein